MAQNPQSREWPDVWRLLTVFFGYLAAVRETPKIARAVHISSLVPKWLKRALLGLIHDPDFWFVIGFTLALFLFVLAYLGKKPVTTSDSEQDDSEKGFVDAAMLRHGLKTTDLGDQTREQKAAKVLEDYFKQSERRRIIRSLGLALIRDWILDKFGVSMYGTFRRPREWPPESEVWPFVDRFRFKDKSGCQFQYAQNFENISVRMHPSNATKFDTPVLRLPNAKEFGLLLVGSSFFPFWYIGFGLKRPYVWIRSIFRQ